MAVVFPGISPLTNFSFAGSFNGLAFGPGSNFDVVGLDGLLDLPATRVLDVVKAQDQGAFLGPIFAAERQVILQLWVQGNSTISWDALVAQLQAAAPISQVESPLYYDGSTRLVNCRVTRRRIPFDVNYQGRAGIATIEFMATDPRIYDAILSQSTIGPGTAGTGFTFPFTFPLTFGAGATGNTFTATNNGSYPTLPVATISGGAITNPSIQNVTAGLTMLVDITLATTDTLVIDFGARTIVLNGTASRRSLMDPTSRWWSLAPGANTIKFTGTPGSGSPQLSMTWRNAWL